MNTKVESFPEVQTFRISIPEASLIDLQDRLRRVRWPEPETVSDWSQGVPLEYLSDFCRYWLEDYDFVERQERLNRLPQFRSAFDGFGIHFVHARSPEPDALPLLLTHGWPGSFVEFFDVIPLLTDPRAHGGDAGDAFHVVCPSLPGYAFSDKPKRTGFGVSFVAELWARLMARLGYARYVAQGGDWGATVTTELALQDPEHCAAIHLNMAVVGPDPDTLSDLTEAERSALEGLRFYREQDSGYARIQRTRPQTLGYALADSPVGQAAWILEKFHRWSDCEERPEEVFSRDALIDNIMLYWLCNSGASSARLYWESMGSLSDSPVSTPMGMSVFPKEIFRASRRWVEKRFQQVVYWNELEHGGHFAAFECPEAFADELRACFRSARV